MRSGFVTQTRAVAPLVSAAISRAATAKYPNATERAVVTR
jgi:hypothetical protein